MGFPKVLRDIFLVKHLMIEAILRFFYVLNTLLCICCGFFLLFAHENSFLGGDKWMGGIGFSLILFGPIIVRLIHEGVMIRILELKNIMEINAKIKGDAGNATSQFDTDVLDEFVENVAEKAHTVTANMQQSTSDSSTESASTTND